MAKSIQQRLHGKSVEYLAGRRDFWSPLSVQAATQAIIAAVAKLNDLVEIAFAEHLAKSGRLERWALKDQPASSREYSLAPTSDGLAIGCGRSAERYVSGVAGTSGRGWIANLSMAEASEAGSNVEITLVTYLLDTEGLLDDGIRYQYLIDTLVRELDMKFVSEPIGKHDYRYADKAWALLLPDRT